MANMADNNIKIVFVDETSVVYKNKIFNLFKEEFPEFEIPDYIDFDTDVYDYLFFESKWSAPTEWLQNLVDTEECVEYIIGVSTEFSNDYVEAFKINKTKKNEQK